MLRETVNTIRATFARCAIRLGLGVVLFLTATSAASADGFSLNSLVVFAPRTSTYSTSNSTRGCPSGFVGKFSFSATLEIKAGVRRCPASRFACLR